VGSGDLDVPRFGKTKPNLSASSMAVMTAAAVPPPRYSGVSHLPDQLDDGETDALRS
jgi:hypothetical protein